MSVLVTFTELFPLEPLPPSASFHPSPRDGAAVGDPATHCGSAMDLVTPAVGPAAVGYSFEAEDGRPVYLPPVWRCGCGFQLDAWIQSPYAYGSQDGTVAGPAHSAALPA
ncbi:hypothetical protein [Pseudarthrobacter sp. L1SW]|uniref:hypothetical protein n=1 Tax=Pseudarthrobacter sp. L1SW TaxID=2851598 RepID=UPI001E55244F|nr:hypothetical protein [Pseudarthrobacter sp. L1SW]